MILYPNEASFAPLGNGGSPASIPVAPGARTKLKLQDPCVCVVPEVIQVRFGAGRARKVHEVQPATACTRKAQGGGDLPHRQSGILLDAVALVMIVPGAPRAWPRAIHVKSRGGQMRTHHLSPRASPGKASLSREQGRGRASGESAWTRQVRVCHGCHKNTYALDKALRAVARGDVCGTTEDVASWPAPGHCGPEHRARGAKSASARSTDDKTPHPTPAG